jgi:hypothetical protein
MLSPVPFEATYNRSSAPKRGEEPLPVVSGRRRAPVLDAGAAPIGTRHSEPWELARVATSRRPSALAASDV